ncbi:MAG: hypothetical protein R6U51_10480 [Anaerolineales bacterium]
MKDALNFGLKSFFAGFLGCLGVIVMGLLATAVFLFAFKSQIQSMQTEVSQTVQSIPDKLSEAIPDMGPGGPSAPDTGGQGPGAEEEASSQPLGEGPDLFIFLTEGEDPNAQKINTFTKAQAKNVSIWVQSPPETSVNFQLELIIPDGTAYPFGENYQTDPSGKPVMCGKLDAPDPPTGTYMLKTFPEGSESPAAAMQFTITE